MRKIATITYVEAHECATAALRKASEIGVPMCVALVDSGCNLLFFARQDDAMLIATDIAIRKARTSVALRMSTKEARSMVVPGQHLYGVEMLCGGRYATWTGGELLMADGEIIGGIGASGGNDDQDEAVALAGVGAVREATSS